MIANENSDYTRFPIVFVQDKEGKIVFESTDNVSCEVLDEYHDEETSGKDYPSRLRYLFRNGCKTLDYTLEEKEIIEAKGVKNASVVQKLALKAMGIAPSYARYKADGEMILHDGKNEIHRFGGLIYESMYPGQEYRRFIEQDVSVCQKRVFEKT